MPTVANVYTGTSSWAAAGGLTNDVAIGADVADDRSIVFFHHRFNDTAQRDNKDKFTAILQDSGAAAAGHFDEIRFERISSSFAPTHEISWTVVEFQDAPQSFNAGVVSIDADPDTVALGDSLTDATGDHVWAIFSVRTDNTTCQYLPENWVQLEFNSASEIQFAGNGTASGAGDVQIAYQLIEWTASEIEVQRGKVDPTATNRTADATITAVDLDKTFATHNGLSSDGGSPDYERAVSSLELTSTTNVRAERHVNGSTDTAETPYQVVEFTDTTSVQVVETAITDTNSTPATQPSITAVSTSVSAVISDTNCTAAHLNTNASGVGWGRRMATQVLDGDGAGVTLTRDQTTSDIAVFTTVIEFGGAAATGPAFVMLI